MEKLKMSHQSFMPTPPGASINKMLDKLCMNRDVFAARMGMSLDEANALIEGETLLSPEIARKLEEVLGVNAVFWIREESHYRSQLAHELVMKTRGSLLM